MKEISLKNSETISKLRNNFNLVEKKSGYYIFWISESVSKELLRFLKISDEYIDKIQKKSIDKKCYYALYLGISNKDLNQRAKWHIKQKHTYSLLNTGFLSTFRKTLGAVINKLEIYKLTNFEESINDFLDKYCIWEWEYHENPKNIEKKELEFNNIHCYPLNIQGNKSVNKEVISTLKSLRKEFVEKEKLELLKVSNK